MSPGRALASSSPPPAAPKPPAERLARLGGPMLGLLAVQFLLGMALNLYVVLPSGAASAILESSPVLLLHSVVAVLLVGLSASALTLSLRLRRARAILASALAFISALVATAAGASFSFGSPTVGASLLMSVGFVGLLAGGTMLLAQGPLPPGPEASRGPPIGRAARSEP